MMHERIFTNELKHKRGLHNTGLCDLRMHEAESLLHVMRECTCSRRVWELLLKPAEVNKFFREDLHGWVRLNLNKKLGTDGDRWCELHSVLCWLKWRKRNEKIFDGTHWTAEATIVGAKAILRCMGSANTKLSRVNISGGKPTKMLTEHAGDNESTLIFVDGAFSTSQCKAACGGVLRNGSCMEAFMMRLQEGDSVLAELWDCLMGLKRAWDNGVRNAVPKCDAIEAIELIQNGDAEIHREREVGDQSHA